MKTIIFFARDYQAEFFYYLQSEKYNSVYVTLTIEEKKKLIAKGIEVKYCFEEFIEKHNRNNFENVTVNRELFTSFYSDRYYGKLNQENRGLLLKLEFSFWEEVVDYYSPHAILNEVIAIEISEVMEVVSKQNNILYFAWMVSPFEDRGFYWLSNPFHASLNKEIFDKEPSLESLEKGQKYINTLLSNYKRPFYARNLKKRTSLVRILSLLLKICYLMIYGLFKDLFRKPNTFIRPFKKGSRETLKHYFGILSRSIYSFVYRSNYVNIGQLDYEILFYPLHYEPEASIIYFSEFNENQISFIRNISKLLGAKQCLVIKEHPQQPGMLLTREYRKLQNQLSNIYFLPAEYPTNTLIQSSTVVVTQTSTAGWEALMYQKPVVVFGKVFYDKHVAIERFSGDWEKLREKIRKKELPIASFNQNLEYVAQLWQYCSFGNPYPNPDLYSESNISNIVKAIENRLFE